VTKGIQQMQAGSNLPISAWLPLADLNGGKMLAGCRSKPSADWQVQVRKLRSTWKKNSSKQHPPPSSRNSWAYDTPHWNFQSLPWAIWIFSGTTHCNLISTVSK